MKRIILLISANLFCFFSYSQTLQSVTDSGNTTTKPILIDNNLRIDARSVGYSEGLSINAPTDMGYGGINFHSTVRNGVFNGSSIKWGIFYNYAPELGIAAGGGLSFFRSNSITSLYLANNGNVGIGLVDPSVNLHIQNPTEGTDIDLFKLKVSYGGTLSKRRGIAWEDPSSTVTGRIDTRYDGTVTKMVFGSLYNRGYTSDDVMTISGDGNVGIGTTNPNSKLAVNGNIRAREIKVETANWPDYVFAEDYALPTLQETEKHIKEKGHLPGIPSAAEVKANGIDIGEMNAKLLQKIEELTLYLIEIKKQADNEKKLNAEQNALLKEEINQLKSKYKGHENE